MFPPVTAAHQVSNLEIWFETDSNVSSGQRRQTCATAETLSDERPMQALLVQTSAEAGERRLSLAENWGASEGLKTVARSRGAVEDNRLIRLLLAPFRCRHLYSHAHEVQREEPPSTKATFRPSEDPSALRTQLRGTS